MLAKNVLLGDSDPAFAVFVRARFDLDIEGPFSASDVQGQRLPRSIREVVGEVRPAGRRLVSDRDDDIAGSELGFGRFRTRRDRSQRHWNGDVGSTEVEADEHQQRQREVGQ